MPSYPVIYPTNPQSGIMTPKAGVPVVQSCTERKKCIIEGKPGFFLVSDSSKTYDWRPDTKLEFMKGSHPDKIGAASLRFDIDPILVQAIMERETACGWYDFAAAWIDKNKTILPMNIHSSYWAGLGYSRDELKNVSDNIEAGALLISRIARRLTDPSVAKIGSVYQFLGCEVVSHYGFKLAQRYQRLAGEAS
jgi:hypothetical protein